MRRSLELIGMGALSIFLWAVDATADELADPIEFLTDDGQAIGEMPAERNYIPFDAQRGDARMGVTTQGDIFVALGDKLCSSSDDGRTWTSRDLPVGSEGFGGIADDVRGLFGGWPRPVTMRSTDLGRTWSEPVPVDIASYEAGGGGWTQVSQLLQKRFICVFNKVHFTPPSMRRIAPSWYVLTSNRTAFQGVAAERGVYKDRAWEGIR